MNLKKLFVGFAAALSLLTIGVSLAQSNTAYADEKIPINKANKDV